MRHTWRSRRPGPTYPPGISKARAERCSWINFDADAEQDDSLPTFEW
jgi:hypothetical protein